MGKAKNTPKKVYFHKSATLFIGKKVVDPNRAAEDDSDDDAVMKDGIRQRTNNINEIGQAGQFIRFLFSNAGLVYACIIYATAGVRKFQ